MEVTQLELAGLFAVPVAHSVSWRSSPSKPKAGHSLEATTRYGDAAQQ